MLEVRDAVLADAEAIASVHVRSWQETYRGLIADEVLDAADFVDRRVRLWTRVLSGPPTGSGLDSAHVAVGLLEGRIVGFGSTGPSRNEDLPDLLELWTLYSLAHAHGSGLGAALTTHLLGDRPAVLWVAAENARARAFYRKQGFAEDGATKTEDGFNEIRMVRHR